MHINVRRVGIFKSVCLSESNVNLDLGYLDVNESQELAYKLREAAFDLDNGEAKEYLNPGLEKALELVNDYLKDLRADGKINEASWVEVVRDHIKSEMED